MLTSTVLIASCLAASAAAQQKGDLETEVAIRILDLQGRWTEGRLRSANATQWTIIEASSESERTLMTDRIAAFISDRIRPGMTRFIDPAMDAPSPIAFGLLELANGQRLPGSFRSTSEGMFWDHRWIGSIPIATEEIASIRLRGARTPARRTDGDTILFTNGDQGVGFIESLGNDVLFEPSEADPQAPSDGTGAAADPSGGVATTDAVAGGRKISIDRLAAIAFAQTDSPTLAGMRLWVVDGSLVGGSALTFDSKDGWGFTLTDPVLSKVRANRTTDNAAANPIAGLFAHDGLQPVALLGKPAVSLPSGQFRFGLSDAVRVAPADRALLGLAAIELTGPIVARFTVPPSTTSGEKISPTIFSCELSLRQPAPIDARVDVEITLGGARSERITLDSSSRRVPVVLSADLDPASSSGRELVITVTDGGNGIAGDVVVLERACLLHPGRTRPFEAPR
jgi:hypothetical protein